MEQSAEYQRFAPFASVKFVLFSWFFRPIMTGPVAYSSPASLRFPLVAT